MRRWIWVLALLAATAARAEMPPSVAPDSVGLSPSKLAEIGATFTDEIDGGRLPGVSVLIYRAGGIPYFETIGVQDPDTGVAMAKDTIFRIYSMTKPIVSFAIMMLVEDSALALTDPVSKYIPELAAPKVVRAADGAEFEPAAREITVQDLLRHTSGITYGVFGDSWLKREYKKVGVNGKTQTIAEMTAKLGTLPLAYQPGSKWEYGRSTDVLGYLIEVVSGQPLDDFLHARIFAPLGMTDTGFFIPADQVHRAAEPQVDPATGRKPVYFDVAVDPIFLSGGGGLVSTSHDYLRFCRMMLNGGELDGVRLLRAETVALMTRDHLGAGVDRPFPGYDFGLGFAVRNDTPLPGWPALPGEYGWAGYAGTYFWIDPKRDMIVIYMSQQTAQRRHYRKVIRNLVGHAVVD